METVRPKTFYAHQCRAGCVESFLDFSSSRLALERGGWQPASTPEEADIILVNTCVVGRRPQASAIEDIASLGARRKPGAELVVTGCLPSYDAQSLARAEVGFAFSPTQPDRFADRYGLPGPEQVERLESEFMGPYTLYGAATRAMGALERRGLPLPAYLQRRFALVEQQGMHYLRISRGCLDACSFCATRFATGTLRSQPMEEVLARFDAALAAGRRNIVLCGEEPGAYGQDLGADLPALLRAMLSREGDFILSIRQHHPVWIIQNLDAYLEVLSDPRVRSICIPLQSGSDRVLELMGRRYRAEDFSSMIREIHRRAPQLMLRTHVMVGFPTETREDFLATCRLVRELPWDMVLTFPYTDRPRTRAAGLAPKVSSARLALRMAYLGSIILKGVYLNHGRLRPLVRGGSGCQLG